jgi:hypothetical protein
MALYVASVSVHTSSCLPTDIFLRQKLFLRQQNFLRQEILIPRLHFLVPSFFQATGELAGRRVDNVVLEMIFDLDLEVAQRVCVLDQSFLDGFHRLFDILILIKIKSRCTFRFTSSVPSSTQRFETWS